MRHDSIVLRYARSFSRYTDPGEYARYFASIPDSISDVCRLIKSQLIHPAARERFKGQLPEDRTDEDRRFITVVDMLEALLERNASGLTEERPPSDRLIVSCRFHALLLASIMKYKAVPCRVRAGFASYLVNGKFIDHWICEVWDQLLARWRLVDADIWMSLEVLGVDFDPADVPRDKFVTAGSAWLAGRDSVIDPELYGIRDWWGMYYIRDQMSHDVECLRNNERTYTDLPVVSTKPYDGMSLHELGEIDRTAEMLSSPDRNFRRILNIGWTRNDAHAISA